MKKVFKIISVICVISILFACVCLTASAEIPTKLTFTQVKKAPTIDASIDDIYGEPVVDFRATDTTVFNPSAVAGDPGFNIFPRQEDWMNPVKDAYEAMRVKGYVVFNEDYLYMAYDVYDVAPRTAGNAAKFYQSTNLQLVFFVNENLGYITAAYAGKDSVRVFNDDGNRSTMIIENIDCKLKENSKTNYIYEMRIPWSNFHEVETLSDITDFKFALTQTSMGSSGTYNNGSADTTYVCSAIGSAYALNYEHSLPVTLNKLAGANTDGGNGTGGNTDGGNGTASQSGNANTQSGAADAKPGTTGNSVDFGTTSQPEINSDTENESKNDGATTGTVSDDTETEKDYTLVIILSIVAVLVIAGGVVAIILINKGGKSE